MYRTIPQTSQKETDSQKRKEIISAYNGDLNLALVLHYKNCHTMQKSVLNQDRHKKQYRIRPNMSRKRYTIAL